MLILLYLFLGLIGAIFLLWYAKQLPNRASHKLLGRALIIAALIYPLMALIQNQHEHLLTELSGIVVYGLFYLLSFKHHINWLAIGWLLHPVWDVFLHLYGPIQEVVPIWYAWACVSFDVLVGVYIFVILNPKPNTVKP